MFLQPFFERQNDVVQISAHQASRFAKDIASDFNPIHDEDAKRFCVPGDLLFALVLANYGLSQSMNFKFEGMVAKDNHLLFPSHFDQELFIRDDKEKQYLSIQRNGENCQDPNTIEQFIRSYVSFSGLNFTQVLVPLMKQHQVMINPTRPLVIYESMSFELQTPDIQQLRLELANSELEINGKRGDVTLHFDLFDGDKNIGTGKKTLVLSGLRPFEEDAVQGMCNVYENRKNELV